MKEYKRPELVVTFELDTCIHSGMCTKGLPEVFNIRKRPWVDVNKANVEEITAQVDLCPSGALGYRKLTEMV